MNKLFCISSILFVILSVATAQAETAVTSSPAPIPHVEVKGLFKASAVLIVNGKQKLIKEGETYRGVKLLSATSKGAVIELNGKRIPLGLSRSIGTAYTEVETKEVRLAGKQGGHHFGTAKVNGHSVQFLVDTGASLVSMSSDIADRIGLKYARGAKTNVSTAQGSTIGYRVTIKKLEVGPITLNNVQGLVLKGEYPLDMLLGNSFLSQLNLRVENGIMVLETKNGSK